MTFLSLPLLLLSFPLSGSSGDIPYADTAPTLAPGCDVTIRGIHGGADGRIYLIRGEVRNRTGWWDDKDGFRVRPHQGLEPRERFSEVVGLDFSCKAHRRYRFLFTAKVDGRMYEYTHYYPSDDDFTQETVIDLGDVSRFFEVIEPAAEIAEDAPAAAEDQPLAGLELEGEWVRRESNNNPNDGMKIVVSGNRAEITFVPESAESAWKVGRTVWQEISSDGSLEVMGSNRRYYPAQLTPNGASTLEIDVHHTGAGNDQTWVRAEGCWPDQHMASYSNKAPNMWVRYSTALPDGFTSALKAARDAHAPIQTATLTPYNEWVVVAANKPCYSAGFPSDVREWIDSYIASGREIDVVAFGPGRRWLVVAEDLVSASDYLQNTIPGGQNNDSHPIIQAIRRQQENDRRVTSFAYSGEPDTGWAITAGGKLVLGERYAFTIDLDQNAGLGAARTRIEIGRNDVHEVAIAPDGSWVLVAEDMFITRGAPESLIEWLETYRTDHERRIDHVVLHPINGRLRWAIISNTREPQPGATDFPDLVEHGLPGDRTIYQRMKLHGITGLSIALVENNEVAWTRSYGLRHFDEPESYASPSTIFDAASISKPVTYAAVLRLVDSGHIDLTEEGILYDLAGDELPSRDALDEIRADEINLGHLLSHCAGIDHEHGRGGVQAFDLGESLPTISQMFKGTGPASPSYEVVKVDNVRVGEMVDYSGANSLLVQALIEHHADGGYDGQMRRLLDDLNMSRSTFSRNFDQMTPYSRIFAYGHRTDSTRTTTNKTDLKVFPNQAAAGLRTTPSVLAQFVIMLNQGGMYDGTRILEEETVDRFLGRDGSGGVRDLACEDNDEMQLGINAVDQTEINDELFWHGGLHNGYRSIMYGLPQRQAGLVIFLTGRYSEWSQGRDVENMRFEIKAAVENAYGWDMTLSE